MVEKTIITECFFCGKENAIFSAIANEGIVDVCYECSQQEHIPMVKKPTKQQLIEAEKRYPTFKERAEKRIKEIKKERNIKAHFEKQNFGLRDIVNKNYKTTISAKENPNLGLIDNFHWIVMRARKKRHLTYKQVADSIQESETAIHLLEQGQLPLDYPKLINKIEKFFNIIIKEKGVDYTPLIEKSPARMPDFNPDNLKNLTIADLQRMKKEKEDAEHKKMIDDIKVKLIEEREIDIK